MNNAGAVVKVNAGHCWCRHLIIDGRHDSGTWSRSQTGSCELINCCCFVSILSNCTRHPNAHTQMQAVKDTYIRNTHGPLGNEAVIPKWHRFREADNNVIKLLCPKGAGEREREREVVVPWQIICVCKQLQIQAFYVTIQTTLILLVLLVRILNNCLINVIALKQ